MLTIILLIVILQVIMFFNKKADDLALQAELYENQRMIIDNQHSMSEALLLIIKLSSNGTMDKVHPFKLPDIELPN